MYLENLEQLAELLHERKTLRPRSPTPVKQAPFPRLNTWRKDDNYLVTGELPGLSKENVTVEIKDRVVRIAGKRTIERDPAASVHRQERTEYEFDRSITMPFLIDVENVKAKFADGVLEIELRPDAADQPKRIEIN